MKRRPPSLVALALLAGLAMSGSAAAGQRGVTIDVPTLVGFKAPVSDEAGRTVALVTGNEARPSLVSGLTQVTGFRLETYRYAPDRETELLVESPQGLFGPQGASSDRALTLRSVDGRFSITGTGWSWAQASGRLVISNAVRTVLRRATGETNRPPLEVSAARFEYSLKTGDARYEGDCVALEPGRVRVSAGVLVTRLSPRDVQPHSVSGTNGVSIELLDGREKGRASGRQATYDQSPEGERIRIEGGCAWQFGPGEGSADALVLLPARESYTARGHARLRLRPLTAAPRGIDPQAPAAAPAPRGAPIDIECESMESSPGEVVFAGPVVASQEGRLELRCDRLVASLAAGPAGSRSAVSHALATGRVSARVGTGPEAVELRGGEMAYTLGEHALVEVRDHPEWRGAGHEGRGDVLVIHPEVPTFQTVGNVRVLWRGAGPGTNAVPIEVTGQRLVVESDLARFSGSVAVRGARWDLQAAEVGLLFTTNRVARALTAREDVALDYRMVPRTPATNAPPIRPLAGLVEVATEEARHWRITAAELRVELDPASNRPVALDAGGGVRVEHVALVATGGRVSYRADDGIVRLVDGASLRTLDGLEIEGEPATALAMDPASGRFRVEGAVRRMSLPARSLREPGSTTPPPGR